MTLRLKTRLTLTITVLVLLVLSIVSFFTIINFAEEQIRATYDGGDLIGKQIYGQVKQALIAAKQEDASLSQFEGMANYITNILSSDMGLPFPLAGPLRKEALVTYVPGGYTMPGMQAMRRETVRPCHAIRGSHQPL